MDLPIPLSEPQPLSWHPSRLSAIYGVGDCRLRPNGDKREYE
jgi:hypothetical protein